MVLSISGLNSADSGDAHAVQIRARLCRVPLKIAMQRALLLRDSKFVAWLGEMVHSDIQVAGLDEFQQARAKNLELSHAFREMRDERALLLLEPRDVSVAEERDTVRTEPDNLIHGVGEAVRRLVRQAVNQIHVDALETETARAEEQVARHFVGLQAMHRFLHVGVKILDAHAEAVEAELAEGFKMCARCDAWIDFDADFTIRCEVKAFACKCKKILDLLRGKIRRCAAAPMELHYRALFGNAAADAFGLALQHVEIRRGDVFVLLDHHIAGAKQAEALAERDMHVQGNGCFRVFCLSENFFEVRRAERVVPNGRGRIAGVARAGTIVFRKEFFAEAKLVAHLLEGWIGKGH